MISEFSQSLIDLIDLDMIKTAIGSHEVISLRCQTYTVYVRSRASLGDTSAHALMKYAVTERHYLTGLRIQLHHADPAVVISRNIEILVIFIDLNIAASHATDPH